MRTCKKKKKASFENFFACRYGWDIVGPLSCLCVTHLWFHVFQLGYLGISILTRLVAIRSFIYYCHMKGFGSVLLPNESCGWTLKTVKNPSLRVGHRNWSFTILIFFFFLELQGCFRILLVLMGDCCLICFHKCSLNVLQIKWWCEVYWRCCPNQSSSHLLSEIPPLVPQWLALVCFALSFVMMMKKNI